MGSSAPAEPANDAPASTETAPLTIIGHWPPSSRRGTATISWTSPDTIAQAPHTRSTAGIRSPGFRGCAFLNAAAEYPDPDHPDHPVHPVHRAVLAHRQWFLESVTELLAQTGDAPAGPAGRHLVMLRDGAMAAGCLTDPEPVCETFLQGVEGILRARSAA